MVYIFHGMTWVKNITVSQYQSINGPFKPHQPLEKIKLDLITNSFVRIGKKNPTKTKTKESPNSSSIVEKNFAEQLFHKMSSIFLFILLFFLNVFFFLLLWLTERERKKNLSSMPVSGVAYPEIESWDQQRNGRAQQCRAVLHI